ncbi:MAG: EAL domain-containing protein [Oscillospiraceae bacterium]|nr:EAL domain-containing protein [Oscillospiraceae bacterium]
MKQNILKTMENGELQAFYQPQYDAISGKIVSAEALVRWIKPDGSMISPDNFIPDAETKGYITEIDWYMTEQVCQMLNFQKQNHEKQFPVAINFSRHHIQEANFTEKLCAIADKYAISHELLEVEITESAMVNEESKILDWLESVRTAGFTIAIDDFGSGLSSLQFVKDMPADVLKIDKSLLSHNCENEKERVVLESIFYFANRLHMTTIAEGVETKEQLQFLRTCDCKKIQGYLIAKPMSKINYLAICRNSQSAETTEDILEMQTPANAFNLLMRVIFQRYPLVIFSNLTRNSYYMMAYEDFTATACPSTGIFEELIIHGASSMHPDDQEIFAQTFNRINLLKAYADGKSKIRLVTRQLGDDGKYRPVETTDYFIKNSSSDDILVITLCENLPNPE